MVFFVGGGEGGLSRIVLFLAQNVSSKALNSYREKT